MLDTNWKTIDIWGTYSVKSSRRFLASLHRKIFGKNNFHPLPDDVYLVSYPRCGNTWVRFLIANLLSYPSRTAVDFYSVHQIIPDLEIREQRGIIRKLPSPRIIKSHAPYRNDFPRVIYLVRDGRDVYVSYFNFLTKQGLFSGTLADMLITANNLPYGSWHAHVSSWLENQSTDNLLLVRYENLLQDPPSVLKRILDYIGLGTTKEQLAWAIVNSSFQHMRYLEKMKGRPYGKRYFRFVRKGQAGRWSEHFDELCKEIFKTSAGEVLIRLGYVEDNDW